MTTKTAQFTPGPWKAVPDRSRNMYTWYVEGAKGVVPAIARLSLIDACEEIEGNANLIAAAPAMYAIIKDMREAFYVKGTRKALLEVMERSKNVLAQAEGRHHE